MRIIITTDGSDFSRAAVERACQIIAAPERTSIKIVSVYEIVEPIDISISPEFSKEIEASAREKSDGFVAEASAAIRTRFPAIELETLVTTGTVDEILIDAAREWKADLIVIGSHGRGFWERMLIGSITDSLVHHAPCSVLVVKKSESDAAPK